MPFRRDHQDGSMAALWGRFQAIGEVVQQQHSLHHIKPYFIPRNTRIFPIKDKASFLSRRGMVPITGSKNNKYFHDHLGNPTM